MKQIKYLFLILLCCSSALYSTNATIEQFFILFDEYVKVRTANASQDDLQKLHIELQEHLKSIKNAPSAQHMAEVLCAIIHKFSAELTKPAIQKMISAGLIKEQELTSQGYIPFIHGRRRHYDFLTQLYSFLKSITTGKKINIDFIPTRVKKPATDWIEEKRKRKDIITHGIHNEWHEPLKAPYLLFLNHFMFGNIVVDTGGNSFEYMLYNMNCRNITLSIANIFAMFKLENLCLQYHKQLNVLNEKYNNISTLGQLIQIGIKPEKLKKSVYFAAPCGPKISLDSIQSNKIDEIIAHIDKYPIDWGEFVLVNTFDKYGGLNEHGMKMSILDPADYDPISLQKKIACNKERDELFAAIEADYKALMIQTQIA